MLCAAVVRVGPVSAVWRPRTILITVAGLTKIVGNATLDKTIQAIYEASIA